MKTIKKIITPVNCKYGAPMGRDNVNIATVPNGKLYDCAVPMSSLGDYDKGGLIGVLANNYESGMLKIYPISCFTGMETLNQLANGLQKLCSGSIQMGK